MTVSASDLRAFRARIDKETNGAYTRYRREQCDIFRQALVVHALKEYGLNEDAIDYLDIARLSVMGCGAVTELFRGAPREGTVDLYDNIQPFQDIYERLPLDQRVLVDLVVNVPYAYSMLLRTKALPDQNTTEFGLTWASAKDWFVVVDAKHEEHVLSREDNFLIGTDQDFRQRLFKYTFQGLGLDDSKKEYDPSQAHAYLLSKFRGHTLATYTRSHSAPFNLLSRSNRAKKGNLEPTLSEVARRKQDAEEQAQRLAEAAAALADEARKEGLRTNVREDPEAIPETPPEIQPLAHPKPATAPAIPSTSASSSSSSSSSASSSAGAPLSPNAPAGPDESKAARTRQIARTDSSGSIAATTITLPNPDSRKVTYNWRLHRLRHQIVVLSEMLDGKSKEKAENDTNSHNPAFEHDMWTIIFANLFHDAAANVNLSSLDRRDEKWPLIEQSTSHLFSQTERKIDAAAFNNFSSVYLKKGRGRLLQESIRVQIQTFWTWTKGKLDKALDAELLDIRVAIETVRQMMIALLLLFSADPAFKPGQFHILTGTKAIEVALVPDKPPAATEVKTSASGKETGFLTKAKNAVTSTVQAGLEVGANLLGYGSGTFIVPAPQPDEELPDEWTDISGGEVKEAKNHILVLLPGWFLNPEMWTPAELLLTNRNSGQWKALHDKYLKAQKPAPSPPANASSSSSVSLPAAGPSPEAPKPVPLTETLEAKAEKERKAKEAQAEIVRREDEEKKRIRLDEENRKLAVAQELADQKEALRLQEANLEEERKFLAEAAEQEAILEKAAQEREAEEERKREEAEVAAKAKEKLKPPFSLDQWNDQLSEEERKSWRAKVKAKPTPKERYEFLVQLFGPFRGGSSGKETEVERFLRWSGDADLDPAEYGEIYDYYTASSRQSTAPSISSKPTLVEEEEKEPKEEKKEEPEPLPSPALSSSSSSSSPPVKADAPIKPESKSPSGEPEEEEEEEEKENQGEEEEEEEEEEQRMSKSQLSDAIEKAKKNNELKTAESYYDFIEKYQGPFEGDSPADHNAFTTWIGKLGLSEPTRKALWKYQKQLWEEE